MLPVVLSLSAFAVPSELTHQGRILDSAGLPMVGTEDVTVRLFELPLGGSEVWSETISTDFDNGYFSIQLGQSSSLDVATLDVSNLFVELELGGTAFDRQPVVSVPYAMLADTATNVAGGTVDATEIQVDGTTVIDSDGMFVGALDTFTLGDLTCSADQVAMYDGSGWGCSTISSTGATVSWNELNDVPLELVDGDDDSLAAMSCADGEVLGWSDAFSSWGCVTDRVLTGAEVDSYVTDGPLDLAVGTTLGGADVSVGDHYDDLLAVAAMGTLGDGNPLNHVRYSDADAIAAVGPHYSDADAILAVGPHYDDSDAIAAVGPHYTDAAAIAAVGPHYTDTDAVNAVGPHYTDTDAVNAVGPHYTDADAQTAVGPHYTDAEAQAAVGPHYADADAIAAVGPHYTDADAQAAIGPHYTDADAVNAVTGQFLPLGGGTVTGDVVAENSYVIRRIQRTVGQLCTGVDGGLLPGRALTFTKTRDDTTVRVTWSDNRRGLGYIYGYWEILIDGNSCTSPSKMRFAHHSYTTASSNYNDNHYNAAIIGYCDQTTASNLPAGDYTIAVNLVHQGGNNSDWYAGWGNGECTQYVLEAEEVY